MVTYIDSSNATKYNVLFSKATQDLIKLGPSKGGLKAVEDERGKKIKDDNGLFVAENPITTVEQYFSYLPYLIEIGASLDIRDLVRSEGRKYTMLPTDENYFVVNGNSRDISVPPVFQSNGISVQGDKFAEVLYFKVDRFFDVTDLDTCDIYVQWTRPDGESGFSVPWVVDIESEPNKMIVGWAISGEVTKVAGQIKFALRFFQWDDKNAKSLKYSWSTTTQTCLVKPSLDFNFGGAYHLEEESNPSITDRIKNSSTQLAGVERAKAPVFIKNLTVFVDLEDNAYKSSEIVKLKNKKEVKKLSVEAVSVDGGSITYSWKYRAPGQTDEQTANLGGEDDSTETTVQSEFVPVVFNDDTAEELLKSGSMFYKEGSEAGQYIPATPPKKGSYGGQSMTFYRKESAAYVNRVGKYKAVAENRLSGRNKASSVSIICEVPMPSNPKITTNLNPKETLGIETTGDGLKPIPSVTMSVVATNEEENGTKQGVLRYVWYKRRIPGKEETKGVTKNWYLDEDNKERRISDALADWIKIEGAEASSYTITNTEDFVSNPKNVEGSYMVEVYNYKNLKNSSTISAECKVSYPATKPVISYPRVDSDDAKIDFSNENAMENNIRVDLDGSWTEKWNISDNITYQWYQTNDDISIVENDTLIEGATESKFRPTDRGKYYCEVTNHKNGTVAKQTSSIFYVV